MMVTSDDVTADSVTYEYHLKGWMNYLYYIGQNNARLLDNNQANSALYTVGEVSFS